MANAQIKEEIWDPLRSFIKECYQLDIDDANFYFSTQNYAFLFPGHPFMIRVSMTPRKTRRQILSELLWVDDLKSFKDTICEPSPSLRGNLLEEIEIDGTLYRASMFRTARGHIRDVLEMDPMYFICVGEALGAIHATSVDENLQGIHFDRPTGYDKMLNLINAHRVDLPENVAGKIDTLMDELHAMPKMPETYGLCHGDFHSNNYYVEYNNVWLFDFDDCEYEFYLYDIATALLAPVLTGYKPEKSARVSLDEDVLPYFRIGYELHMNVGADFYDKLDLFIRYRLAFSLLMLYDIKSCGMVKPDELLRYRQAIAGILVADDFFGEITKFRSFSTQMTGKKKQARMQNQADWGNTAT